MREQIEQHLQECAECRDTADGWGPFEAALREDAANRALQPPGDAEVSALLAAARDRRKPARPRVVALRWAGAIAAMAILGVVAVLLSRPGVSVAPAPPTEEPTAIELTLHRPDRVDVVRVIGRTIEAPADGRAVARLGADRIEVASGGRVELLRVGDRTRLGLERGRIECRVAARGDRGEFVVVAGAVVVRVVGTRFAVTRGAGGAVAVAVDEGTVEVLREAEPVARLDAGDRIDLGADGRPVPYAPTADEAAALVEVEEPEPSRPGGGRGKSRAAAITTEPIAGLATWRQWIVDGRLDEAASALDAHLARAPGDTAAWTLLADCRRKQGRPRDAIAAHRQVIERAPAAEANRARFMAGSLAQDRLADHAAAERMFAAYLASPGRQPLAGEALVRRARSLIALGRDGAARPLLERTLAEHAGTGAAASARRLLDSLGDGP